ncbi:uncharacterized transmembrane protein DDB_G0289901-like isoform X2 [Macrobrachium rosenbergii]|uniref:uncharacterized transmembrane protein DDB_G0289901-like isoform X2 n=1 Tax=Macrobrachium rosenbergii TaxID=79674 RepID=UPI0034D66C32
MAQNLLQLLTALFLCFNLASGDSGDNFGGNPGGDFGGNPGGDFGGNPGGNPGGNFGGNPGGNPGGCTYNDEWHTVGDNFVVQLSTGGPPEGNAVHYLCTGTGLIMVGCALPQTPGNPQGNGLSFPVGSKRYFGCDEYECKEELGWTSTGVTAESCITNPPPETTTPDENGDSTVGGESTNSGNEGTTEAPAATTPGENGPTTGGITIIAGGKDSTDGGESTSSVDEGFTP